jgi:hypothetical protein
MTSTTTTTTTTTMDGWLSLLEVGIQGLPDQLGGSLSTLGHLCSRPPEQFETLLARLRET